MRRSSKSGLRFVSACPYQYATGTSALDDMCAGADVADEPRVCDGVDVWSGAVTEAAEMVPGSMHPPYSIIFRGSWMQHVE